MVVLLYSRVMSIPAEQNPLVNRLTALELKLQEQDAKLSEALSLLRQILQVAPQPTRRQIGFVLNP
jgi:hypothetical protein